MGETSSTPGNLCAWNWKARSRVVKGKHWKELQWWEVEKCSKEQSGTPCTSSWYC